MHQTTLTLVKKPFPSGLESLETADYDSPKCGCLFSARILYHHFRTRLGTGTVVLFSKTKVWISQSTTAGGAE